MVAEVPEPDATLPTEETTPGVTDPPGSVTLTASPAATSPCREASRAIVTTCCAEVAASTGPVAGPPRLPITLLTRIAAGSNTAEPSVSDPDGLEMPSADCSCSTPYVVSQE